MSVLWGIIVFLLAIVWVITVVDIFRSHLGAGKTAAWVLIVVLVPFIGAILYWVLRPQSPDEKERQIAAAQSGARAPFDSTHVGR